jgi:hypothetical protein
MVLFGRTREEMEAEAERIRQENPPHTEGFWLTDRMTLGDFPPIAR